MQQNYTMNESRCPLIVTITLLVITLIFRLDCNIVVGSCFFSRNSKSLLRLLAALTSRRSCSDTLSWGPWGHGTPLLIFETRKAHTVVFPNDGLNLIGVDFVNHREDCSDPFRCDSSTTDLNYVYG